MPEGAESLHFSSAMSTMTRVEDAGAHVVRQLRQQHPTPSADLVLAFASATHAEALDSLHEQLTEALAPRDLLMTTGPGVLGAGQFVDAGAGLSLLAANLPGVAIEPLTWEQKDWPDVLAGPGLVSCPASDPAPPPRGVVFLADRTTTPWRDVVPRLQATWPEAAIVGGLLGGGVSDGAGMWLNGRFQEAGAVALVLRGPIDIDASQGHGARPFGRPHLVTAVDGQAVYALGGRNPVEVAHEEIRQLPRAQQALAETHGLLVGQVIDEYQPRFGRGDFQVHELSQVDRERGALTVGDAALSVGQTVRFHLLDPGCVATDLEMTLQQQRLYRRPAGALLFTSLGRRLASVPESKRDPALIEDKLGSIPLAGLCPAAEIGPTRQGSAAQVCSASLMLFRPAAVGAAGEPAGIDPDHGRKTI